MIKCSVILFSFYVFVSISLLILNWTFPSAVKQLVFLNLINRPGNLTNPETYGLDRVHNFYLNVDDEVRIGLWHYRSPLVVDQPFKDDEDYFRQHLWSSSNIPVIIYLHGNAFDRSFSHRRVLCQRLRDELKYDVIALDYRGFGDSTGEPTEKGLVKDVLFIHQWLRNASPHGKRRIYLWGHSLGSAVATQVAAQLSNEETSSVAGLILEAPFLDIHQALLTHWFSLFFRWQPWYYGMTQRSLQKNKLAFLTREHIAKVNCPCVLLHADDDLTVPYIHSKQLLQTAMNARDRHRQEKNYLHFQIDMISYHRSSYGHRLICEAPKLVSALK